MPDEKTTAETEREPQPRDSLRGVAPAWRTASLVFASLAALLTALGPVSTWINGVQDRRLQERRAYDEISLRYMDLLLRGFETPEERKATLTFLEKALSVERPRELMLQVVSTQLDELERASGLQQEIAASAERAQALEEQMQASVEEASRLRARLASMERSARSDAATRRALETELEESERLRDSQQRDLEAERQLTGELVKSLNEAKAAAGARAPAAREPSGEDALARYFEESGTPEAEQTLLRSLDSLCKSHHGKGSIIYFGPNAPGISCVIGSDRVSLDQASLELPRHMSRQLLEIWQLSSTGNAYADAMTACSSLGGQLVSESVTSFGALCKMDSGRGKRIDAF